MQKEDEQFLIDLESTYEGHLTFKSDPHKHMEYFMIKDAQTGDALYSVTEK